MLNELLLKSRNGIVETTIKNQEYKTAPIEETKYASLPLQSGIRDVGVALMDTRKHRNGPGDIPSTSTVKIKKNDMRAKKWMRKHSEEENEGGGIIEEK